MVTSFLVPWTNLGQRGHDHFGQAVVFMAGSWSNFGRGQQNCGGLISDGDREKMTGDVVFSIAHRKRMSRLVLRKADEPMKTFNITETEQGTDFGNFQAEDKKGALEALAKDAGYSSYAEMCEVASNGRLRVTEVESA